MQQMQSNNTGWRCLPLISSRVHGDSSQLTIEHDAYHVLHHLYARSIHVLGLFGPPNTGKRLFLNTLLHTDYDFAVPPILSHTDNKVLLWLWTNTPPIATTPTDGDSVHIVISSGTYKEITKHDEQLRLALLLLLSSAVIYNDDGEINAAAIERLEWLASVTQVLRIKANQDEAAVGSDFHQHAPKLVWLGRNFKVKWLTDSQGGKLSPLEYLEQCLAEESGFSEQVLHRNTLRMYLQSYFTTRDCVALSRAVEGTTTDSIAPNTAREVLRAQFIESVDKFYTTYLSNKSNTALPPKYLMGNALRAEDFGIVLESYIDVINANKLPTIQQSLNALMEKKITAAFKAAKDTYETATTATTSCTTIQNTRELQIAHFTGEQLGKAQLNQVKWTLPEDLQKTTFKDQLVMFEVHVKEVLAKKLQDSTQLSQESCQKLISTLLPQNLEQMTATLAERPRDSFPDGLTALLTQYGSSLTHALSEYRACATGPAVDTCLEDALLQSVFGSIQSWGVLVLRQYQQHILSLKREITTLEQAYEAVKAQDIASLKAAADQKGDYDVRLDKATQELAEMRQILQGELNDRNTELERLMHELTTMDMKHNVRVVNLESDLTWVRSRTAEVEKAAIEARSKVENNASGAAQKILLKMKSFHEEERALLVQQKRLMDRIVELECELVQKKTTHAQKVFTLENDMAKMADEMIAEHVAFARQLKLQTKNDTGLLKLAYQKKKASIQSQMQDVDREIADMHEKLALADAEAKIKTNKFFKSASVPLPALPILPFNDLSLNNQTSKLAFARSTSLDVSTTSATIGPNPATRAAVRAENEMCKQS